MYRFKLTLPERRTLEYLMTHTHDATTLRRAQALLWIDEGERVTEVAARLRVSRQVVYQWMARLRRETIAELPARLEIGFRCGRPRTVAGIIDPFIDEAIDHDPRTLGYNSTIWTASLLCHHLESACGLRVSIPSVRLALARLGLRWKRPRHQLALRPPTWRQAMGGLKKGFTGVNTV